MGGDARAAAALQAAHGVRSFFVPLHLALSDDAPGQRYLVAAPHVGVLVNRPSRRHVVNQHTAAPVQAHRVITAPAANVPHDDILALGERQPSLDRDTSIFRRRQPVNRHASGLHEESVLQLNRAPDLELHDPRLPQGQRRPQRARTGIIQVGYPDDLTAVSALGQSAVTKTLQKLHSMRQLVLGEGSNCETKRKSQPRKAQRGHAKIVNRSSRLCNRAFGLEREAESVCHHRLHFNSATP